MPEKVVGVGDGARDGWRFMVLEGWDGQHHRLCFVAEIKTRCSRISRKHVQIPSFYY